jgi:hypothetical protein
MTLNHLPYYFLLEVFILGSTEQKVEYTLQLSYASNDMFILRYFFQSPYTL